MDGKRSPATAGAASIRVIQVFCRRLGRHLDVAEHARCAYCNGDEERIRTARHEAFCDFLPGVDPTCFGFPEDRGRYRR